MPVDNVRAIHYRRSQEVKKFKKKLYQLEEKHKLQQIAFEEEINQKKVNALREYLKLLEIKKLTLESIQRQRIMQENAERLLNII